MSPGPIRTARARLGRLAAALRGLRLELLVRYTPGEEQHLLALTVVVGLVCGLVAVAFHLAIQLAEHLLIERALSLEGWTGPVFTVLSPTLGGLAAGVLLHRVIPGARGSGIPQVKQAYLLEGGRVPVRDAVGKFLVGALQIGSGASLGREGPTVQICAGTTHLLARLTALPPRNMRRLIPVGVAAGIAAAFNAPIAAVTFTIEEIVGSLDHTVLSGVVIAAALAAVVERSVLGVHPVIEVAQAYGLDHASSLPLYAALGVAASLVSVAFTDGLLRLRSAFRGLTVVPVWAHPAIGGLATGLLAAGVVAWLGVTGVNGGGYQTLGVALGGGLALRALLVLCVVKLLATVLSYASGGAGGIFAPALFVGAMLGGAVGYADVALLQHESHQLGAFALVGMGAVFAGVIRAPVTSVLIIFEMTGGYGLVLPLMIASMTSFALARRWRPTPIYDALLIQDGVVLPHPMARPHPLEQLTVADAMRVDVVVASLSLSVGEAIALMGARDLPVLPVVEDGTLRGLVASWKLRAAARVDPAGPLSVIVESAPTIRANAPLVRAVVQLNEAGGRRLVVVDSETGKRLVGILSASDLVRAHARTAPRQQVGSPPSPAASFAPRPPAPRAGQLAVPVPTVPPNLRLAEVLAELERSRAPALLVDGGVRPGATIIVAGDLREILEGEETFRQMLVAADLGRPAPTVGPDLELDELAALVIDRATVALVVRGAGPGQVLGVITRPAIAEALLEREALTSRERRDRR